MNYKSNPFSQTGFGEDMFFLSNGHISPVYYSVLSRCGFFLKSELSSFRRINSRLQGHPTNHDNLPGIRIASGSLGQGMSVSIGCSIGKKLTNDNNLVYSFHGDGELNEGQIWESIIYAGAKKIDNYIASIDYNKQQIDGPTNDVLPLGDLNDKFRSFGWHVLEELHGNDIESVIKIFKYAKKKTGKGFPVVIIFHTTMGKGVDFMEGSHVWHGKCMNEEEFNIALSQNASTNFGDF